MSLKIGLFIVAAAFLFSCGSVPGHQDAKQATLPLAGTWRLISGTTMDNKDTIVTDYTKDKSFIKIINDTHFSFLSHDLSKGKTPPALFSAGGGAYSLNGDEYTEHLEYCSDREWEGNDFKFKITINNDTLVQTGIEKIDSLGVNRINTEKYVRIKN
ncbi:MAG TPA: hypothetical protein VN726_14510 [Hanamia sp.]|nr:hypothetical protein [Hanamia sp.]